MATRRRAMVVTRSGGPEVMVPKDEPIRDPGAGEVLIEVAFAGVNFADLAARAGVYSAAPRPPMVVGFEVSGRVAAVGPGVTHVAQGDRVIAVIRFGGYASHVVARADSTRKIPDSMTLEHAAAIPVTYATAWYALVEVARVRAGESVLIHAAAGGVGVAAIQLARHLGLETFGTASTDEKLEFCKKLGLEHGINYSREDFARRVRALTAGRGVHLVIDSVGGPILKKSFESLAVSGMVIIIGAADLYPRSLVGFARTAVELARMKRFSAFELIETNRCVAGLQLLLVWDARGSLGTMFDDILALWEKGVVRPVVDQVFPLTAAGEAHRYLADRRTKGKVLLDAAR
ncbi:MAG: zinc-binding dehydrogenase [Deltaproteobacteria bacterium]|nr:zinc-binding dehydrogenase [Deltaproteobacteria bacterium]